MSILSTLLDIDFDCGMWLVARRHALPRRGIGYYYGVLDSRRARVEHAICAEERRNGRSAR